MNGFSFSRWLGILIKEFIQLRRDRLTFGMIIGMPDPAAAAVRLCHQLRPQASAHRRASWPTPGPSPAPTSRRCTTATTSGSSAACDEREADDLLDQGAVQFVVTFPPGFHRDLVRGETPALLVEADATDPMAAGGAISALNQLGAARLRARPAGPASARRAPPVDLRVHRRYNPEGLTAYNIVPGLMGVILTMTMVLMTGLAMTRERERGTFENLLSTPATADRGDDRQDRALHPDRPHPGHADPAGGALALRRADARQPAAALWRGAALHLRQPDAGHHLLARSRATSCRRCR